MVMASEFHDRFPSQVLLTETEFIIVVGFPGTPKPRYLRPYVPSQSLRGTLRNAPGCLRWLLQSYWWPHWSWAAVRSRLYSWLVNSASPAATIKHLGHSTAYTGTRGKLSLSTGLRIASLNCASRFARTLYAFDKCPGRDPKASGLYHRWF